MNTPAYIRKHELAMSETRLSHPRAANGHEAALIALFKALSLYADANARTSYPIGDDNYAREHFAAIAAGIIGLLNCETGRIDCGTMDGAIRKLGQANGFTAEEADGW